MTANYRRPFQKIRCSAEEAERGYTSVAHQSLFRSATWLLAAALPVALAFGKRVELSGGALAVGFFLGVTTVLLFGVVQQWRHVDEIRARFRTSPERFDAEIELDHEGVSVVGADSRVKLLWSEMRGRYTFEGGFVLVGMFGGVATIPSPALDDDTRAFIDQRLRDAAGHHP
jgi:hypothetical protein